jgi:hypothetical protein
MNQATKPEPNPFQNSSENSSEITRLRFVFFVWIALNICIGLIGLMTPFASGNEVSISEEQSSNILAVFVTMGLLMTASSLFLRFYTLGKAGLAAFYLKNLQQLEPRSQRTRYFKHWMLIHLFTWSLNESIASLGLVVTKTGAVTWLGPTFAAVGLGLNLLAYPNFPKSMRLIQNLNSEPNKSH